MNVEKSKANTGHNVGKEIIYQVLGQKLLPSTPFNGERLVFHPNSGCPVVSNCFVFLSNTAQDCPLSLPHRIITAPRG